MLSHLMLWFPFLLFDHFTLRTNTSTLKLPSDTLRLEVLLSSLSFSIFSFKTKAFHLVENSFSFLIKPKPHTCIPHSALPLLTEECDHIALKAMMSFACRKVACVSYKQTFLPLHSPRENSLQNYYSIFHNI